MNPSGKNNLKFFLIIVSAVTAGLLVFQVFGKSFLPWRLGLDLVGGSYLVYEADMKDVAQTDRASVLNGLRDVMERRVNVFGVSEPRVTTAKVGESHQLIVELAGIQDVEEAIKQIGRTALLDFREVDQTGEGVDAKLNFRPTQLTGRYLQKSEVSSDRNTNEPLITGQFTFQEVQRLVSLFNAGALPAPLSLISRQTVGASLGLDSLNKAITAGAIGTLAIILFLILYYGRLGFVAALALIFYIVYALAIFKIFGITMTLAGVAGFILSIGMAVDANILIFARTKEESAKGVSRAAALEEGFRRAWPSIRDSNISTMLTTTILYYLTSSFVRGFALTLFLGVLLSMFSAITVSRVILRAFIKNNTNNNTNYVANH